MESGATWRLYTFDSESGFQEHNTVEGKLTSPSTGVESIGPWAGSLIVENDQTADQLLSPTSFCAFTRQQYVFPGAMIPLNLLHVVSLVIIVELVSNVLDSDSCTRYACAPFDADQRSVSERGKFDAPSTGETREGGKGIDFFG